MTALEILSSSTPVTLTSELALEIEDLLDRALVAHYTGYARNPITGNGIHYAPAFDEGVLGALSRRGLVMVESRGPVVSPLVWLTDEGHEVIGDIIQEGAFDAHVEALQAI